MTVTFDEAMLAVDAAKRKAHAAAKKYYGPNMTGPTSPIVDAARLVVLETTLAAMMAERSTYAVTNSDNEVVVALEMRDYWEAVADEVAK